MSRSPNPPLALYHYPACPFCALVRQSLKHIDVPVEQRDIHKNASFRQELIREGGKPQVPCLRIEENGTVSWLYESRDIIRYLHRQAVA